MNMWGFASQQSGHFLSDFVDYKALPKKHVLNEIIFNQHLKSYKITRWT
jgi:hypothetical protein